MELQRSPLLHIMSQHTDLKLALPGPQAHLGPPLLFTLTLTKIKAFFVQSSFVSKNVFFSLTVSCLRRREWTLKILLKSKKWVSSVGPRRRLLWHQNSNSNLQAGISNVRLRDGGMIKSATSFVRLRWPMEKKLLLRRSSSRWIIQ
jgi:hypothetical protein